MNESDSRAYYVRAYARLDEMVKLFLRDLASRELLDSQREAIERELKEALGS